MPLDRRVVETSLKKKGFVESAGDHAYFTYYTTDGQKTSVWTKTSHGSGYKTLGDKLTSAMAKQCGLSAGQFKQLVECPLSQAAMETILVETGRISPAQPSTQSSRKDQE
jgi:hypothetical protein